MCAMHAVVFSQIKGGTPLLLQTGKNYLRGSLCLPQPLGPMDESCHLRCQHTLRSVGLVPWLLHLDVEGVSRQPLWLMTELSNLPHIQGMCS